MTLSKWTAGGIALAILLVGFGFGRFATPSKVVERDRIVETTRDTELTWHAYVGHTESKIETKTQWQTVTKWEPGGTIIQTVQAVQDHTETAHTDTAQTDGKFTERVVEKIVERERIVEAKAPDWLLGGKAGLRLDTGTPVYGGEVARRIIGPVFAGAWVQASGASREGAAAGVGVSFLF
jgi:hypothetical protein